MHSLHTHKCLLATHSRDPPLPDVLRITLAMDVQNPTIHPSIHPPTND